MTCSAEKITHWLNNELSVPERQELENHIAGCANCRDMAAEAKKVMQLLQQGTAPEPGADMELRFQATLSQFKESLHDKQEAGGFWYNWYKQISTKPAW